MEHCYINGVFFQHERDTVAISKSTPGMVRMLDSINSRSETLCRFIFNGFIWKNGQNNSNELTGGVEDFYGHSQLSKINISGKYMSFTKKYIHRNDWIVFVFTKRDGNIWVGQYDGPETGTGIASCIITEFSEDFFSSEKILKQLNLEYAHKWPS